LVNTVNLANQAWRYRFDVTIKTNCFNCNVKPDWPKSPSLSHKFLVQLGADKGVYCLSKKAVHISYHAHILLGKSVNKRISV